MLASQQTQALFPVVGKRWVAQVGEMWELDQQQEAGLKEAEGLL